MVRTEGQTTQTWAGVRRGARDMLPVALFVFPFGIAFGVAAIEVQMRPIVAILMSITVWAGASQFAALEFWSEPIAFIPLLLVVFAVNARLLLLGASIYPWMRGLPWLRRHLTLTMLTDINWAYALQRNTAGDTDTGILIGSGLVMWFSWVGGTVVGALFTNALIDPKTLALDTVMVSFFATVLADLGREGGRSVVGPWITAAVVAVIGSWTMPTGWHILAGGLAGGLVGGYLHGR